MPVPFFFSIINNIFDTLKQPPPPKKKKKNDHLNPTYFPVTIMLSIWESQIFCRLVKCLIMINPFPTTNFRLLQTERVCRRQF